MKNIRYWITEEVDFHGTLELSDAQWEELRAMDEDDQADFILDTYVDRTKPDDSNDQEILTLEEVRTK